MTVQQIQNLLVEKPETMLALADLIRLSIKQKRTLFKKADHQEQLKAMSKEFAMDLPRDQFQLNYDSLPVCEVLGQEAERILRDALPADPAGALTWANKFCEEIRKPAINTWWYGHLESGLESYVLVYLNHVHGVDVTGFIKTITPEMREHYDGLRIYERNYTGAFPHLTDPAEKAFETLACMYSKDNSKYLATECLDKTGLWNAHVLGNMLDSCYAC